MKTPLFIALLSSFILASAQAAVPERAHLVTTGYGEVMVKPDMAQFSVRVTKTLEEAEQAKATVDQIVAGVLEQLQRAGVAKEQMISSNLSLAPQYHYPSSGKPELIGYQAMRTIEVSVERIEQLNLYLDIALTQGVTQVDKVNLKVKDQAHYQQQAQLAAIQDAKQKAAALAKGFDRSLGSVWQINYNGNTYSQPIQLQAMSDMSRSAKIDESYQDASIVIRDRVEVIYLLGK